jgi:hypothetical protein
VTRLSRFHPQASGLYYTHVNPTSHPAIAKPDPTTSNIKHPSILHLGRVSCSGSIRKCIDQLPSAKVRRPRQGRCCVMLRAKSKQTSTRCVTSWQLASFGTQSLMPRSIWTAPVIGRNKLCLNVQKRSAAQWLNILRHKS